MTRTANLIIHKEEFSFSAGHFTIFSAKDREQLHGHNYSVSLKLQFNLQKNGLSFDYRDYKQKIHAICAQLDRRFLLPTESPYLMISEEQEYIIALFDEKKMPFLKTDVVLLPLSNITIEELSRWFLQQLLLAEDALRQSGVYALNISVYNGPNQSAGASWRATS